MRILPSAGFLSSTIASTVVALALAGCGSKETLISKSAEVPPGMNLSGFWTIQQDSADTVRQLDEAGVRAAGGREGIYEIAKRKRDDRSRTSKGSLVHVFLETAEKLKITQTDFGLFVSFDRAIVEEYRFGENTLVSVGPVNAARVSGWEEGAYVIETLDNKQNKLVERYQLEDGGNLLIRQISIWQKGELGLSLVQKFDRT